MSRHSCQFLTKFKRWWIPIRFDVSREETIESHSKILKCVLYASILTVLALGVGGAIGLSLMIDNNNEQDLVLKINPGDDDVPLGQEIWDNDHDVVPGSIELFL